MSRDRKRRKWIQYHSQPAGSTVDAVCKLLKQEQVISIASVLFKSHPILEQIITKDSNGKRKPINSNEVHGVFTTSNPKGIG